MESSFAACSTYGLPSSVESAKCMATRTPGLRAKSRHFPDTSNVLSLTFNSPVSRLRACIKSSLLYDSARLHSVLWLVSCIHLSDSLECLGIEGFALVEVIISEGPVSCCGPRRFGPCLKTFARPVVKAANCNFFKTHGLRWHTHCHPRVKQTAQEQRGTLKTKLHTEIKAGAKIAGQVKKLTQKTPRNVTSKRRQRQHE